MAMSPLTMTYLKPGPNQLETMTKLRASYTSLLAELGEALRGTRYKSLAVTALEESAMWAMKAVTRDSDGSPVDGAEVGDGR